MSARRSEAAFRIRLPATSANLGPAFDAAALAFNLFLEVRARPAKEFAITASGRDSEICGQLEKHLILETYLEVLRAERKSIVPLTLQIRNDVPIGKGCGSSASARLAGIALAVRFGKLKWNDARIVGEASYREHHPDNASACWLGGIAVARMSSQREAEVAVITPKGKWPLLLAVPEQALSTERARSVLPRQYSRADTVTNIQNSMLLLAAFTQARADLLRSALHDRIHQPYRAALCPLLPALKQLELKDGVLGAVLSGAGPSVLIFVDPAANPTKVKQKVQAHLAGKGLQGELISTSITRRGGAKK
jgi:homoserine kinase